MNEFSTLGNLGDLYDPFHLLDVATDAAREAGAIVHELVAGPQDGGGMETNEVSGTGGSAGATVAVTRAQVTTQTDPLTVRSAPDGSAAILGLLPRGSFVTYDETAPGPGSASGWAHVLADDGTHRGWSARIYLTDVGAGTVPVSPGGGGALPALPVKTSPAGGGGGGGALVAPSIGLDTTTIVALSVGAVAVVVVGGLLVFRHKKAA